MVRTSEPPASDCLLPMRTFPSLSLFPWLGLCEQPYLTCSSGHPLASISKKPQSSKAEARRPQLFTLWTGSPLAASPSSAGAAPLLPLAEPVNSWSM